MQRPRLNAFHIRFLQERVIVPLMGLPGHDTFKDAVSNLEDGAEVSSLQFTLTTDVLRQAILSSLRSIPIDSAEFQNTMIAVTVEVLLSGNIENIVILQEYCHQEYTSVQFAPILTAALGVIHISNCTSVIHNLEYLRIITPHKFLESLKEAVIPIHTHEMNPADFQDFFAYLNQNKRTKSIIAALLKEYILDLRRTERDSATEQKCYKLFIVPFLETATIAGYNIAELLEDMHNPDKTGQQDFSICHNILNSQEPLRDTYCIFLGYVLKMCVQSEMHSATEVLQKILTVFSKQIISENANAKYIELVKFFADLDHECSFASISKMLKQCNKTLIKPDVYQEIEKAIPSDEPLSKFIPMLFAPDIKEKGDSLRQNMQDAVLTQSSSKKDEQLQIPPIQTFHRSHIDVLARAQQLCRHRIYDSCLHTLGSLKIGDPVSLFEVTITPNKMRNIILPVISQLKHNAAYQITMSFSSFLRCYFGNDMTRDFTPSRSEYEYYSAIFASILAASLSGNPEIVMMLATYLESNLGARAKRQHWISVLSILHTANCTSLITAEVESALGDAICRASLGMALSSIPFGHPLEEYDDLLCYARPRTEADTFNNIAMTFVCRLNNFVAACERNREIVPESAMREYKSYGRNTFDLAVKIGADPKQFILLYFSTLFETDLVRQKLQRAAHGAEQYIAPYENKYLILHIKEANIMHATMLDAAISHINTGQRVPGYRLDQDALDMLREVISALLKVAMHSKTFKDWIGIIKTIDTFSSELVLHKEVKFILSTTKGITISNGMLRRVIEEYPGARAYFGYLDNKPSTVHQEPVAIQKKSKKKKTREERVVELSAGDRPNIQHEAGPSRIDEERERLKNFLEYISKLQIDGVAVLEPESGSSMYRLRCSNKEQAAFVKKVLTHTFGTEIETEIIKGKEHIINIIKIPEVAKDSLNKSQEMMQKVEDREQEGMVIDATPAAPMLQEDRREEAEVAVTEEKLLPILMQYDSAVRGMGLKIDYAMSSERVILFVEIKEHEAIRKLKLALEQADYKVEWENRRNKNKEQSLRITKIGVTDALLAELKRIAAESTSKTDFGGRNKTAEAKQKETVEYKQEVAHQEEDVKAKAGRKLRVLIENFKHAERIADVGSLGQAVVEYLEAHRDDVEVKRRRNHIAHQGYISEANLAHWLQYADMIMDDPSIAVPSVLLQLKRHASDVEKDAEKVVFTEFIFEGTNQRDDMIWKLSRLLELLRDKEAKEAQYQTLNQIRNMAMHPDIGDKVKLERLVDAFITDCKTQAILFRN